MSNFLPVFLAMFVLSSPAFTQNWSPGMIGTGIKPDLEIDANGVVHIAVMKESFSSGFIKLYSVSENGIDSSIVTNAYVYGPLDLELDNLQRPNIVYHDHDAQDAALATWNGSDWTIRHITSGGHDGWDTTLDFDDAGNPHVLSTDGVAGVEYATFSAGTWNVEALGSGGAMYSFATDIAVAANGDIHATFFIQDSAMMYYALKSSDSWQIEPVMADGLFPSMALTASGQPVIAFYKPNLDGTAYADDGAVMIADKSMGTWSFETVDFLQNLLINKPSFLEGARTPVVVETDASGSLHIAYGDRDLVKYARQNNGSWEIEVLRDESMFPTELGQFVAMALDGNGEAHIAFYEDSPNADGGSIHFGKRENVVVLTGVQISCPEDIIIDCGTSTDPSVTGMALADTAEAVIVFQDSTIQGCPMDVVIRRTWTATLDESSADTCFQFITIRQNGMEQTSVSPLFIALDSICLTDIETFLTADIVMGCEVQLNDSILQRDSLACDKAFYSRHYTFSDPCKDTTFVLSQNIEVSNYILVEVVSAQVMADSGNASGSIALEIGCESDSLQYNWSNGGTGVLLTDLEADQYSVTISNAVGCAIAFDYVVNFTGSGTVFMCPPDTTISCDIFITPEFTGQPVTEGYDQVDFFDNILQTCPDDIIVERFWIGTIDSTVSDTCKQVITVTVDSFEVIEIPDTLFIENLCLDEIDELIELGLNLPCNLGIDTVAVTFDSASCELFTISADWVFTDECRDTSIHLSQVIVIRNPLVVSLNDLAISGDAGDSTGSVFFTTSCVLSPLTYEWSDGSIDSVRTGLSAGDYTLYVTNSSGCIDSFLFSVPAISSLILSCPADTIVGCTTELIPAFTGSPVVTGVDSGVLVAITFADSILQECPGDLILERTWNVVVDSSVMECVQVITRLRGFVEPVATDSITLSGICIDSFLSQPAELPTLGCDQVVDSTTTAIAVMDCSSAELIRSWAIRDTCVDTTFFLEQLIRLDDIPLFELVDVAVIGDNGDTTGSIGFGVSGCDVDSLTYEWSDGSSGSTLTMVAAGAYAVTISNKAGCTDTFSFVIESIPFLSLECPPDTTLSCGSSTDPMVTGEPLIEGFDSSWFEDIVLQDCPDDLVIERIWRAQKDSTFTDSCTQLITVLHDAVAPEPPDTTVLVGICVPDVALFLNDTIAVGCNQVIDTTYLVADTIDCDMATFRRIWEVSDECADTSYTVMQAVLLQSIPTAVITNIDIEGDLGDGTGSVQFDIACVGDSVSYEWSDGTIGRNLEMALAGSYSLTVTTGMGCTESFIFVVPSIDTLILECPADTTLACGADIDPEIVGVPRALGYDTVFFNDVIVQDCPDDLIVERTWIARQQAFASDTCVQIITVVNEVPDLSDRTENYLFSGICLEDLDGILADTTDLECQQVIDTVMTSLDTLACGMAELTRRVLIRDECQDSSFVVTQIISLTEIPVVRIEEAVIEPDYGDRSGSILLDVACQLDSLSFSWSNGTTTRNLTRLEAGTYGLTVTSQMGCVDSFSFEIALTDTSIFICPPDTVISCLSGIDPAVTGSPVAAGYNAVIFQDSLLQPCPGDEILLRAWIGTRINGGNDTCMQRITVVKDDIAAVQVEDTLLFSGFCLEDLGDGIPDSIYIGCDRTLNSMTVTIDTVTCGYAEVTRTWTITDECLDTTLFLEQKVILEDIPVVRIDEAQITGDVGDASGSILLTVSCNADSVVYAWSNGSALQDQDSLSFGSYGLTVTNAMGCLDSFVFEVPFIDTTVLHCPPDTTIACDSSIDPSVTGMASIMGFDSLSYSDTLIQDCPGDRILQRTWMASLGMVDFETCIQLITIEDSGLDAIEYMDTLILDGVCIEDLADFVTADFILGCDQSITSSTTTSDTITCETSQVIHTVEIRDDCLDTTLQITRIVELINIPVVVIDEVVIQGDVGDSTGSITLQFSCTSDTLLFTWSNGQATQDISGLSAGGYVMTVTNNLGCFDSFAFEVPLIDTTMLICPPDTVVPCGTSIEPAITGTAEIMGFNSLSYSDSIVVDCPNDQVILRTWIARLDNIDADTCFQLITVEHDDFSAIGELEDLSFEGICPEDLSEMLEDSLVLGCNQAIDTIFMVTDSVDCGFASITRTFMVEDACRGTSVAVEQRIVLNDVPIVSIDDVTITGDIGDSTGSIALLLGCLDDSLAFSWSNGEITRDIQGLSVGDYRLTVTNTMGCTDSFTFTVPFIDTSTTLFTVNVTDRSDNPLGLDGVRFLDLGQNEVEATLRNSAVGNYDYGIKGGLDQVEYICPERNVEPAIAGVTVLDLIRGQRFILGLSEGCPEDELAGDVNFSGDISGSDLVLMRRVMLGLDDTFPDSLTWTFIVQGTTEVRLMNLAGCVQILDAEREEQAILLKAIKLGDYQCQD